MRVAMSVFFPTANFLDSPSAPCVSRLRRSQTGGGSEMTRAESLQGALRPAKLAIAVLASLLVLGSASRAMAVCGDGVIDVGEQCDDGNTLPNDCCSPTCQIEPSSTI